MRDNVDASAIADAEVANVRGGVILYPAGKGVVRVCLDGDDLRDGVPVTCGVTNPGIVVVGV